MFRHVALHEHRGNLRVETNGKQHGRQFESVGPDHVRSHCGREGMKIDNAMKDISLMLACNPVPKGPEVIPEMNISSRLDARKHAGHDPAG